MDCHSCIHLKYDGCRYGRCSHKGHSHIRFSLNDAHSRANDGIRVYNRQICPDFVMKKRCSNCYYWKRGIYFRDDKTPSLPGKCSLRLTCSVDDCKLWKKGPTSGSRKKKE